MCVGEKSVVQPLKYLLTNKVREVTLKWVHSFYQAKSVLSRYKRDTESDTFVGSHTEFWSLEFIQTCFIFVLRMFSLVCLNLRWKGMNEIFYFHLLNTTSTKSAVLKLQPLRMNSRGCHKTFKALCAIVRSLWFWSYEVGAGRLLNEEPCWVFSPSLPAPLYLVLLTLYSESLFQRLLSRMHPHNSTSSRLQMFPLHLKEKERTQSVSRHQWSSLQAVFLYFGVFIGYVNGSLCSRRVWPHVPPPDSHCTLQYGGLDTCSSSRTSWVIFSFIQLKSSVTNCCLSLKTLKTISGHSLCHVNLNESLHSVRLLWKLLIIYWYVCVNPWKQTAVGSSKKCLM